MKRARMQVTLELLADALSLPHGITIERIRTDPAIWMPGTCEVVIAGEDLPVQECRAGELIPEVEAICLSDPDELSRMPRITITFRPKGGIVPEG